MSHLYCPLRRGVEMLRRRWRTNTVKSQIFITCLEFLKQYKAALSYSCQLGLLIISSRN